MSLARAGVLWSVGARYINTILSMASIVILSRLMTPAEVGVFSVSMSVVIMCQAIRDFGTTTYLIQEEEVTRDRLRSVFAITLLVGWTLGALLFVTSPLTARLFGSDGVGDVMRILSLVFFLWPFGGPLSALLLREMRFSIVSRITMASGALGAITSVIFVYLGYSFIGLAWSQVVVSATDVLLLAMVRRSDFLLMPSLKEWRRVISVSGKAVASSLLGSSQNYVSDIAVGASLGVGAAGLYSRALGVINLFQNQIIQQVRIVATSEVARRHRNNEAVRDPLLKAIAYLTGIAWPFFSVLALTAFPVVRLMFGDQWDACIPLVRVLCAGGAIYALWALSRPFLVGSGNIGRQFRVDMPVQFFFIGMIVLMAQIDLIFVAGVFALTGLLALGLYARHLRDLFQVSLLDCLAASLRSLGVTAVSVVPAIVFVASYGFESPGEWHAFFAMGAATCIFFVTSLFVLRHPLADEVRNVIRRRRQTAAQQG